MKPRPLVRECLAETLGTFVLVFYISVIAPLTQAGLNPTRDFGPRLFTYFAGWGEIVIPGPRGGFFTVYIVAPVLGALVGSAAYQHLIHAGLPSPGAR